MKKIVKATKKKTISATKTIYRLIKKDIKKFKKQSIGDKLAVPNFFIGIISIFMMYTIWVKQDLGEAALAELTRVEYQSKSETALATSLRRIDCLAKYAPKKLSLIHI